MQSHQIFENHFQTWYYIKKYNKMQHCKILKLSFSQTEFIKSNPASLARLEFDPVKYYLQCKYDCQSG